jgi:hypothetical protein
MRSMRSFSIIIVSPFVFSQFVEQDVPQMVQRFPELDRVHQSMAVDIGPVMPVQFPPFKTKRGHRPAVCLEPDKDQVTAHAQVKGSPEDVRGLKAGSCQLNQPFQCWIAFWREMR